jgi:S-adenosylmethionine:tRNA ribosyltransferase-isomerase
VRRKGAILQHVTLHVGLGTFRPVRVEEVERHIMHEEHFHISPTVAAVTRAAAQRAGRIIAVGTTVVRTLESAARDDGTVVEGEGWTSLFIYPGYRFRVTGAMLTNFHLPKSTLLMMVCAFAGKDKAMGAYREAIRQRYRFFSFGDAMLVVD